MRSTTTASAARAALRQSRPSRARRRDAWANLRVRVPDARFPALPARAAARRTRHPECPDRPARDSGNWHLRSARAVARRARRDRATVGSCGKFNRLPIPHARGRIDVSQWECTMADWNWKPFPHTDAAFDYAGERLRETWPRLHAGDHEAF